MHLLCESFVKIEEVGKVIHVRRLILMVSSDHIPAGSSITHNNDMLLVCCVANNGIIDGDAFQVVVFCIVLGDESVRNIWDIISCIAFTSQVHIVVLHIKCVNKLLNVS
jgi:hypothetical protein